MKRNGFTLIEVVIAMAVLAFLTLTINQVIKSSTDFKNKNQKSIDQRSMVDSVMRIIERDINLAFNYQDINNEVLKAVEKKKKEEKEKKKQPPADSKNPTNPNPPTPNPPNPQSEDEEKKGAFANVKPREIPIFTNFLGDKSSLHFSNINNFTDQPGQMNGDQQEVGYFIRTCKKIDDPNYSGNCLWRRTSPIVDDKIDEGGSENVLITGVKKFELRYFGKQKEDWVSNWKSDGKEDPELKGIFPQAVEVTLVVEMNRKEMTSIRVVPLRFPNNPEKQTPSDPANTNSNSPEQGP